MKKNLIAFLLGALIGLAFMPDSWAYSNQPPKIIDMTNSNELNLLLGVETSQAPITNEAVTELLGLPGYLAPFANKQLKPASSQGFKFETHIKRLWSRGAYTDEVVLEQFVPVTSPTKNSFGLLNFLSEKVNQAFFTETAPFEWENKGKNDATGFRNSQVITMDDDSLKMRSLGVFMNIESPSRHGSIGDTNGKFDGEAIQYEKGWLECKHDKVVHNISRLRRRVAGTGTSLSNPVQFEIIETVKTSRQTGNSIILTKDKIESLGYTDEQLSEMAFQEWNIIDANPATDLCTIALEIQELEGSPNTYFPQVWINGKDDNSINFRDLMTPWGYKIPDFTLKICGHGDVTTEDLFTFDTDGRAIPRYDAPIHVTTNPTLMGFRGKFSETRFENELPPFIKVVDGDKYGATVDTEGNLTIEFPAGVERKVIGFHIAFKPDTGKSDFYHTYLNLHTGEETLKFWSV